MKCFRPKENLSVWRGWLVFSLAFLLAGQAAAADVRLADRWVAVVEQAQKKKDPGAQVEYLSASFLEVPYRANTLAGGPGQSEVLVAQLDAVDCFTLLDYVEAMRRSVTATQFRQQLITVRYHNEIISWQTRKHFFTDWLDAGQPLVEEVTASIGGEFVRSIDKSLNSRESGEIVLQGVPARDRKIRYIPTKNLSVAIRSRLKNGDYIGIYSPQSWLDVSHVGILVRRNGLEYLRHASSRSGIRQVVDSPLLDYLQNKPGIIIGRPRPL